jgi:fluoride ion exporter CrcB/FEX
MLAYAAAGAAVGAIVRWVAAAVWPSTVWEFVSTLVVAAVAACALGFLRLSGRESGPAVFLWSAAGTAASLGIAATFAVAQQPLWCVVYLILFPVSVAIGFGAGLIVDSIVRRPVPVQGAES